MNSKKSWPYSLLAGFYSTSGNQREAERILLKSVELNHEDVDAYRDLAQYYRKQREFLKAHAVLEAAEKKQLDSPKILMELAYLHGKERINNSSEKLFQYSSRMNMATQENYNRLAQIVAGENIQLICMQYPRQNIISLQKILEHQPGILFLENKQNFETALKTKPFTELFTDSFAGDFGHCTPQGNRLIAENLAEFILSLTPP